MGEGSRLLTAGCEWDGKAGSHLVDGTGSWNGSGTGREIGREHSGEIGRARSRESVGNIVGKTVGNAAVGKSVGNVVGICPRDAVRNRWEHDRERGLETMVEKRKIIPSPVLQYHYVFHHRWS